MNHKPQGYSSASPYIVVARAQEVIDFLTSAFGAVPLRRFEKPDGAIMHAEVKIEDSVIMLAEGGEEWPPSPCWIHLYLADVDEAYRRALAAGGASIHEPRQQEGDPDRRGGVLDPAGNSWWISTQVG